MKHLYYLRHGESELNKVRRWAGQIDTPLTSRGRAQAITAGQQARSTGLKFDLIISSPLERAQDTAKLFAKEVGYSPADITCDARLLERAFGSLEGIRNPLLAARYFKSEAAIDRYPGVEQLIDLQKRADDYWKHLQTLPEDTILVVGHGAFARALWRAINKQPLHIRGHALANARLIKFF